MSFHVRMQGAWISLVGTHTRWVGGRDVFLKEIFKMHFISCLLGNVNASSLSIIVDLNPQGQIIHLFLKKSSLLSEHTGILDVLVPPHLCLVFGELKYLDVRVAFIHLNNAS